MGKYPFLFDSMEEGLEHYATQQQRDVEAATAKMITARRWKAFIEMYCWYLQQNEEKEREMFRRSGSVSKKHLDRTVGVVYLIRSDGLVKIGRTSNLKNRLSQFRSTLPNPFELIHTIDSTDTDALERALHHAYGEQNHHCEWFTLSEHDIDEIVFFGTKTSKIEKRYWEERKSASALARTHEMLSEIGEL